MARVNPADHRRGLELASRRLFLRGTLSIGALSLLTGCNLEDDDAVDRVLSAMSRWNDRVQAALFSRARMAPTYSEADITDPFPFNAYYPLDQVRHVDGDAWRLEVSGLINERRAVDAGRSRSAAADQPDHTPHLHRGLERDRQMGRRPVPRFPCAHRCRYAGAICVVPLRRRLSQLASTWRRRCTSRRCWR